MNGDKFYSTYSEQIEENFTSPVGCSKVFNRTELHGVDEGIVTFRNGSGKFVEQSEKSLNQHRYTSTTEISTAESQPHSEAQAENKCFLVGSKPPSPTDIQASESSNLVLHEEEEKETKINDRTLFNGYSAVYPEKKNTDFGCALNSDSSSLEIAALPINSKQNRSFTFSTGLNSFDTRSVCFGENLSEEKAHPSASGHKTSFLVADKEAQYSQGTIKSREEKEGKYKNSSTFSFLPNSRRCNQSSAESAKIFLSENTLYSNPCQGHSQKDRTLDEIEYKIFDCSSRKQREMISEENILQTGKNLVINNPIINHQAAVNTDAPFPHMASTLTETYYSNPVQKTHIRSSGANYYPSEEITAHNANLAALSVPQMNNGNVSTNMAQNGTNATGNSGLYVTGLINSSPQGNMPFLGYYVPPTAEQTSCIWSPPQQPQPQQHQNLQQSSPGSNQLEHQQHNIGYQFSPNQPISATDVWDQQKTVGGAYKMIKNNNYQRDAKNTGQLDSQQISPLTVSSTSIDRNNNGSMNQFAISGSFVSASASAGPALTSYPSCLGRYNNDFSQNHTSDQTFIHQNNTLPVPVISSPQVAGIDNSFLEKHEVNNKYPSDPLDVNNFSKNNYPMTTTFSKWSRLPFSGQANSIWPPQISMPFNSLNSPIQTSSSPSTFSLTQNMAQNNARQGFDQYIQRSRSRIPCSAGCLSGCAKCFQNLSQPPDQNTMFFDRTQNVEKNPGFFVRQPMQAMSMSGYAGNCIVPPTGSTLSLQGSNNNINNMNQNSIENRGDIKYSQCMSPTGSQSRLMSEGMNQGLHIDVNELKSMEDTPQIKVRRKKTTLVPTHVPNMGPVDDYATVTVTSDRVVVYTCKTCGKSFNRIYNLKSHLRTHTKEKPFACSTCQKAFLRKADMLRHKKIHERTTQYYCRICGSPHHTLRGLEDHFEASSDCKKGNDTARQQILKPDMPNKNLGPFLSSDRTNIKFPHMNLTNPADSLNMFPNENVFGTQTHNSSINSDNNVFAMNNIGAPFQNQGFSIFNQRNMDSNHGWRQNQVQHGFYPQVVEMPNFGIVPTNTLPMNLHTGTQSSAQGDLSIASSTRFSRQFGAQLVSNNSSINENYHQQHRHQQSLLNTQNHHMGYVKSDGFKGSENNGIEDEKKNAPICLKPLARLELPDDYQAFSNKYDFSQQSSRIRIPSASSTGAAAMKCSSDERFLVNNGDSGSGYVLGENGQTSYLSENTGESLYATDWQQENSTGGRPWDTRKEDMAMFSVENLDSIPANQVSDCAAGIGIMNTTAMQPVVEKESENSTIEQTIGADDIAELDSIKGAHNNDQLAFVSGIKTS